MMIKVQLLYWGTTGNIISLQACCILVIFSAYFSILNMETVLFSETPVNLGQTTRHQTPEDNPQLFILHLFYI